MLCWWQTEVTRTSSQSCSALQGAVTAAELTRGHDGKSRQDEERSCRLRHALHSHPRVRFQHQQLVILKPNPTSEATECQPPAGSAADRGAEIGTRVAQVLVRTSKEPTMLAPK